MGRNYTDATGDKNPNYRHGYAKTPLQTIWANMKARCLNPKHTKYHRYGGRGIEICSHWLSFIEFIKWAESTGYKNGMSLDRIDNDQGYNPENCQWITKQANSRKKSTTKISFDDAQIIRERLSQGENEYDLAKEYSVVHGTIWFIKNNFTHVPDGDCTKKIKETKLVGVESLT